jgi:hypothetical protein
MINHWLILSRISIESKKNVENIFITGIWIQNKRICLRIVYIFDGKRKRYRYLKKEFEDMPSFGSKA